MTEARVYLNTEEGPRWCAEDDSGFTGGADRLQDLVAAIREWAADEGFADELGIRLVAPEEPNEPKPVIRLTGDASMPDSEGGPSIIQVSITKY